MEMRSFLYTALLFTLCKGFEADTLILKNGQTVNGRYLSSDANNVQFEVDGKRFRYAVWLIRELRFSKSGVAQPQIGSTGLQGKQQQDAFCQVLRDFQQERRRLTSDPNPIRRAQMPPPDPWKFESRLAAVFGPSGEFTEWTGRVYFTVPGSNVSINFAPTCPPGLPAVTFTNGYPADRRHTALQARISLSSPLAQQLGQEKSGSECRVSGHLFPRSEDTPRPILSLPSSNSAQTDPRQRFEGAQSGINANVTNPQYLAAFSQIQPVSR
jgi:hypothetical protein